MADDTHPPTHPSASLGDVLSALSRWHFHIIFPSPNGGNDRAYRDYFISQFLESNPRLREGAWLTQKQGSRLRHCSGQMAMGLPAPQLWWEWDQGHHQFAIRKLQGVDPLQGARRAAQRS